LKNKHIFLIALAVLVLGLIGYAITQNMARGLAHPAPVQNPATMPGLLESGGKTGGVQEGTSGAAAGSRPVAEEPGQEPKKDAGATVTSKTGSQAAGDPSNLKRGWGLKKNDEHQQPEMPASISAMLARHGSYWIGDTGDKSLYLTFDEGYENGHTAKILDTLKENNVKAAFFITGHYLETNPALVQRMVSEGHIVGNHSDTHPSFPDITDEEIEKELKAVEDGFEKVTGQKGMRYLRAPKGEYSERTLAKTNALGYRNVFWSLALVDWVPIPGGPEEAYRSVTGHLHNGAVILLHAVSSEVTEALDRTIKDAKAQGYTFKTLDDLTAK
jgi:peptidoglycan-N-acetylmuramic acid deacetylase